ncbi:FH19 [Symbiodinium natans]|uniref:FH19 protein n=1 Tax=Symbiodinium natans TaxID=878477 RepID=A0A812U8P0_9DINO|nr:FH19 [Symbiodinium natans]
MRRYGLSLVAQFLTSQGSCWNERFTRETCCTSPRRPGGNPDCWDGQRYTYRKCCIESGDSLARASTKWRVVCDQDVGGWMVHEVAFYADTNCSLRIRNHLRTLGSDHRGTFKPSHAFDLLADSADRFFWYSKQAGRAEAWLGFEVFRPVTVRCVEIFHNNIPEVPVVLEKWQASVWQPVLRKLVRGGFWEYLIAPDDSDGDQEACEGLVTLGAGDGKPPCAAAGAVIAQSAKKSHMQLPSLLTASRIYVLERLFKFAHFLAGQHHVEVGDESFNWFALSHQAQFISIKKRCEALMTAAEQVRSSQKFKEMLDLVIRVGNFINHGVDEVVEGTIRGVSVESLLTLASFKTGAVSSLHFLCLSLGALDPDFFQALKQSLSSVHEASKEKASALKSSIEAFGKDADTAEKQLTALLVPNEEQEAVSASHEADLREMMALWMQEKVRLQQIGDEAFDACLDTQKYFCVSEKALANLPPLETFFLHIATFLDQFSEAWQEIEKSPKKWEEFATAAGFRQRVKRKSLPAGSSQKMSDGPRMSDAGLQRRPRRSECGTASTRPEGKARVKAQARRSVSFLSSFDVGLGEAAASKQQVCRALLGSIYCRVADRLGPE